MQKGGNNRFILISLIVLTIVLLAVIGLAVYFFKPTIPKVSNKVVVRKEEVDPIKQGYKWSGGPNDPKKIIISKIGVDNFVQQVGVNEKNEIAAPTNIYLAGWYNKSAQPGQKGLSIIDGHLDGYTKPGIFNRLGELKTGDEYEIELGNGTKKKFRVLDVETVEANKAMAVLASQQPQLKSQLNLITCGGNFDRKNDIYDKRVIVSSAPVN